MGLRTFLRRRRGRSLGQSLVEFALILPVFLVILSVALDLGRLAYARVTIANVAREASFQAAQTPTSYQAGQPCATDTNMVICRGILESKGSVVTVNPADITLTCTPSCADADTMGDVVTVKATGTFNLLTPVMAVFFGGTTITFSSSATNQVSALPAYVAAAATPTPTPTPTPSPTPSPSPTPTPACTLPSAGFTYTSSPASNKSPVTVTVTDTSTSQASCPITNWAWNWGDGVTTIGQTQAAHVYTNNNGNGGANITYNLSLVVTNSVGSLTSGVASILVKP